MNLTRLMALGTLARYGPQHGHQIGGLPARTKVGEWGGVSVGALYRELRAMEGEGLVETVRTEQVGRRPARTVYEITGGGQAELLDTLRARRNRAEISAVELAAELERLTAKGYLGLFQAAVMRRGVMHL